jgi:hypothetical protein
LVRLCPGIDFMKNQIIIFYDYFECN